MKNKRSFLDALPYLTLAAALIWAVGLYAAYGRHNLDSDMSSEMVLAQLLNEEGKLITENWYYSTELRVVSPVPVYQLGLLLFDSWHAARTFSVAVLLAGAAASFLYLARGAGMREGAVYAAAAIILPVSEAYAFLFTYGGFYTVYFMLACWMSGLVLRLGMPGRRVFRLVLLFLLGIWGGLAGVRMLMICGLPLGAVCAWEMAQRLRRCASLHEALSSEQGWMALGAAVGLTGMLAGYAVNTRVFTGLFHFSGYDQEPVSTFALGRLVEQFETLFPFFGFRSDVPLMSVQGVASLAAICLVFLSCAAVLVLLLGGLRLQPRTLFVPLFALFAVASGMLLNGTTNRAGSVYTVAYYIGGVLLAVASAFLLLERAPVERSVLRAVLMLGSAAFLFVSGAWTAGLFLFAGLLLFVLLAGRKAAGRGARVLALLAACATGLGMAAAAWSGGGMPYGGVFGAMLLAACVYVLLEETACRTKAVKNAGLLLLTLCFALQAGSYRSGTLRTQTADYEEAAAWLVENGFTAGFASFWNGNVLTEASDGALEVYVYNSWEDTQPGEWLQRVSHTQTLPEGRVFVYVDPIEDGGTAPCALEAHQVYRTQGGGLIYAYDSAQEVAALQRGEGPAQSGNPG